MLRPGAAARSPILPGASQPPKAPSVKAGVANFGAADRGLLPEGPASRPRCPGCCDHDVPDRACRCSGAGSGTACPRA
jgi:hypothetical protein